MDKLFLLYPNFKDEKIDNVGISYYCPHCAMIEGIIQYYPQLKDLLEIIYVDFKRPREIIIDLIGEENQGCPVLIIEKNTKENIDTSYFKTYHNQLFVNSTSLIAKYLSEKHKIGLPHP
jgi:protein-disulfide isomerase